MNEDQEPKVVGIEEFTISKVDNGYTIRLRYLEKNKGGMTYTQYGTLIATDLSAVHDLVNEWFGKIV